MLSLHMKSIL